MSLTREDAGILLARWGEVLAAAGLFALGAWTFLLGGLLLEPVGALTALLALAWGFVAVRRLRFRRGIAAPGIVEVDEGQIGYLAPTGGRYLALADIVEVRLLIVSDTRVWRLRTAGGEALLVPVAAAGSEKLFDAFATLPGIDMGRLARALDGAGDGGPLWQRVRLAGQV